MGKCKHNQKYLEGGGCFFVARNMLLITLLVRIHMHDPERSALVASLQESGMQVLSEESSRFRVGDSGAQAWVPLQ